MAFQSKPTAQLTFGMVDETGSRSNIQFDVPYTTDAGDAITAAGVLRALLETLTACSIVSQSLTYSEQDNAPVAASAGSRVERKGVFQFYTAVGKTVTYQLPGIDIGLLKQNGAINEDIAVVQAFVNAVVDVNAIFADSNGVTLTAYKSGYERYRRSTRDMLPGTRTPDADIIP